MVEKKKNTEIPLVQMSKIPKYYWRSLFPSPKRHLRVDCQGHRLVTGRMEVLLFRDLCSLCLCRIIGQTQVVGRAFIIIHGDS